MWVMRPLAGAVALLCVFVVLHTPAGVDAAARRSICGVSRSPRNLEGGFCGSQMQYNLTFCSMLTEATRVCVNQSDIPQLELGAQAIYAQMINDQLMPNSREPACRSALKRTLCMFRFPSCVEFSTSAASEWDNQRTRPYCWSGCMAASRACYGVSNHPSIMSWCNAGGLQGIISGNSTTTSSTLLPCVINAGSPAGGVGAARALLVGGALASAALALVSALA